MKMQISHKKSEICLTIMDGLLNFSNKNWQFGSDSKEISKF